MKVCIITALWKRPEIWELFKNGVRRLNELDDIDIVVSVVGSEREESFDICQEDWIIYNEIPNTPLGKKWNKASLASKETNADYYMVMGSDDIICDKLMLLYLKYMKQGIDYIYLMDGYFYDTISDKAMYWGGYNHSSNKGHSLGAGRLLSKSLMEKLNWEAWYDVKFSLLLDQATSEKLDKINHTTQEIYCKDNNCMLLDIKSSTNMTKFELWDNTKLIDKEELIKYIPLDEYNNITK
jgi:hypothetical protein